MSQFLNLHNDVFDARAVFAHTVCKLIYQKHNGDFNKMLVELSEIREFFDEHVRNVYELVHSEIPLFYYYQLISTNAQNFHITEEEYQRQIVDTEKVCVTYYA